MTKECLLSFENEVDFYGIASLQDLIDKFHDNRLQIQKVYKKDLLVSLVSPSTICVKSMAESVSYGLLLEACKKWSIFLPTGTPNSVTFSVGVADKNFHVYGIKESNCTSWFAADGELSIRVNFDQTTGNSMTIVENYEGKEYFTGLSENGATIVFEYNAGIAGTLTLKVDNNDYGVVAHDLPPDLFPAINIVNLELGSDGNGDGDDFTFFVEKL
jgi:hypothetical protein